MAPFAMMRMAAAISCLAWVCLAALPGHAHDTTHGLMHCYSGRHCPQDTLVFGVIVGQEGGAYTLRVEKTLRGRDVAGRQVRIRDGGWLNQQEIGFLPRCPPPATGDAIVVSYLSTTPMPYRPYFLLRSTNADWRAMTLDADWQGSDRPAIERFVQSGGRDDDFLFEREKVYLIRDDGSRELISPLPPDAGATPPASVPAARNTPLPLPLIAGLAALAATLAAAAAIIRARGRRPRIGE